MIDRLKTFDQVADKVHAIIHGCETMNDTQNASLCVDKFESISIGDDVERNQIQKFRDELCDKTFDLYFETRSNSLNITTINNK